MPDTHGIIAKAGAELAAFPYPDSVRSDQITWQGEVLNPPTQATEWMELVGQDDQRVGVQLDMVRDLHPRYWEWLHHFSNVSFTERGDTRILFRKPTTPVQENGPYLPVEAFEGRDGNFVLYVPELPRA